MRSKFSTLFLASAALAAAALATIPGMAEASTTLNIPFSFTVNGQSLPAGAYSVRRDILSNFIRFQGKDASQSFVWLASQGGTRGDRIVLKFEGQGQTHVLQSVQFEPLVTNRLDKKKRSTEVLSPQPTPGL
jgi:hypothetical protein